MMKNDGRTVGEREYGLNFRRKYTSNSVCFRFDQVEVCDLNAFIWHRNFYKQLSNHSLSLKAVQHGRCALCPITLRILSEKSG